jgi:hypothetical protein
MYMNTYVLIPNTHVQTHMYKHTCSDQNENMHAGIGFRPAWTIIGAVCIASSFTVFTCAKPRAKFVEVSPTEIVLG